MWENLSSRAGWRWLPALVCLALIHGASARPVPDLPYFLPEGVDKIAHLGEFFLLAALLWQPLRHRAPEWTEMRTAAWLFLFIALNGILDEFHQIFVPGRQASAADVAADIAGGGAALIWALHREKSLFPGAKLAGSNAAAPHRTGTIND
ncbi:MAG: VanZ family protein [bacterium]|nr:VanZ family protein [bacterium]